MNSVQEGQVVTGTVTRKIKGGLLVDIGVNVFLPASQVDIRRPPDIGDYIGRIVQCEVLKIDEARRNIVVSRRSSVIVVGRRSVVLHSATLLYSVRLLYSITVLYYTL